MITHYFTPPSDAHQARTYTIKTSIGGLSCALTTCKGLFAYDQVDTGTRMLLETFATEGKLPAIQAHSFQCLDMACGYGIVSYWLASYLTQKKVTFGLDACDVNPIGCEYTLKNNPSMGGKYPGKTVVSDGLDHPYFASKQYDLVMLNPPFSVGKATCHKLITQGYEHLAPGGSLWLVAPTARGAKTYIARCQEQFGLNAVIVCMVQKGYRVWRVEKK